MWQAWARNSKQFIGVVVYWRCCLLALLFIGVVV